MEQNLQAFLLLFLLHSSFSLSTLPYSDFLELGIDLGEFGFIQAQLGNAAFVVDPDRGL